MAARIIVRLCEDETVIHEFVRASTLLRTDGVKRMGQEAMGWLQSYVSQVSDDQWWADVARVRNASEIARRLTDELP